jgi:hypothetical protein
MTNRRRRFVNWGESMCSKMGKMGKMGKMYRRKYVRKNKQGELLHDHENEHDAPSVYDL